MFAMPNVLSSTALIKSSGLIAILSLLCVT
jgi:hypothetical protein